MKKKVLKTFDYIFITRPILFFPGWTTLLLGYLEAKDSLFLFFSPIPAKTIIMAFLSFALAMAGSFILNQLADEETDEVNNKCFFIGKNMIARPYAVIQAVLLLILSAITALMINYYFLGGILFFIILTGYFYNFHPFKLKNRTVGGLAANILMGWLAFYLGWVLLKPLTFLFLIKSFSYVMLNTALYIFTTLPDVEGDKVAGKHTIGVKLGMVKSTYIAVILFAVGLFWGIFIKDSLIVAIFVGGIFHFVRVILHPEKKEVISATKWMLFLYSFVTAMFFPWYFVLMLSAYLITRWYYKQRFDLDYPSFSRE